MTSNQITQLWETHSVPARHHILIVLLNMPRALLLTINTREVPTLCLSIPAIFSMGKQTVYTMNKAGSTQQFLEDLSQNP